MLSVLIVTVSISVELTLFDNLSIMLGKLPPLMQLCAVCISVCYARLRLLLALTVVLTLCYVVFVGLRLSRISDLLKVCVGLYRVFDVLVVTVLLLKMRLLRLLMRPMQVIGMFSLCVCLWIMVR